jgi:putative restriction endonuclease
VERQGGTSGLEFQQQGDLALRAENQDPLDFHGRTWCNKFMQPDSRVEAPGSAQQRRPWRRDELIAAFRLYCLLPFGHMHQRRPEIVALAGALDRTPSSVAMKLVNLASLDPAITSSGRTGLGHASAQDRRIWDEFRSDWTALEAESDEVVRQLGLPESAPISAQELEVPEGPTTVDAMVRIRRGQAFFRRSVLASYGGRCCMSGIGEPLLLLASHIVPWAADTANRLNPSNGLCLSALHDRAFDKGLIAVDTDYRVRVSPTLKRQGEYPLVRDGLLALEGQQIRLPERFLPDRELLAWHLKTLFMAG